MIESGNLFAGILAEHRGLTATMLAMGGGLLVAVGVAVHLLSSRRDSLAR